jgi:hypothetical protein
MPRRLPSYLSMLAAPSEVIRYQWDDWNIEAVEEPVDAKLVESLEKLPRRATLAYAIGSAEWLVHRLLPFVPDKAPWSFLEAAWAMLVDHHYSNYGDGTGWAEYSNDEWCGAIKGPVSRALTIVECAIQEVHWHLDPEPGSYAHYVAAAAAQVNKLTEHVLEDSQDYRQWSDQVIKRLRTHFPLLTADNMGDVVPAEALDSSQAFDPNRIEQLVNAFLASLDWKTNPFLSSPDAMKEVVDDDNSFEGTPYVFDIEADRAKRRR